jgi:hypothetical protein
MLNLLRLAAVAAASLSKFNMSPPNVVSYVSMQKY